MSMKCPLCHYEAQTVSLRCPRCGHLYCADCSQCGGCLTKLGRNAEKQTSEAESEKDSNS